MSAPQLTATSFLVVGRRPLLVIDLPEAATTPSPGDVPEPLQPFLARDMSLLPGLFDIPIPASATLVVAVDDDGYHLRDGVVTLLSAPREEIPPVWADAAEELGGVLVLVGSGLRLRDATDLDDGVRRLSAAAAGARLVGALVEFG